jgi:hypothetical protein
MEFMHIDICGIATECPGYQVVRSQERVEIKHFARGFSFDSIVRRC